MQAPEHQQSKCPKCHAGRGKPCLTNEGREAERVHYGRPYWSSKVTRPWQRLQEAAEDIPAVPGGWGGCSRCGAWMILGPALPETCKVCLGVFANA